MFVASAPSRLDFGGGWTDVPPYPEERGGFVCNLAIERRCRVSLTLADDAAPSTIPLVAAALRRAHLSARVTLSNDFPTGAGLGGSSSAGVALAAAVAATQGRKMPHNVLAEWSRAVEVDELGVAGGRQDHYAAAYGGALGLTFDGTVRVEQIALSPHALAELEARILLVYTGESRISGDTISAVLDAYAMRTSRVVNAMDRMAILARGMRSALHASDVGTLAELVDEHWQHQRALHARITTPRIDALEQAVRQAGARGFKALGASGGGCVMVLGDRDQMPSIADAAAALGTILPWRVATTGVEVSRVVSDT